MIGSLPKKGEQPMRRRSRGVWHLAEIIADDLEGRETGLRKPLGAYPLGPYPDLPNFPSGLL